jgi:hypothetical protein
MRSPELKMEFLGEIRERAWAYGAEHRGTMANGKLYLPLGYNGFAIYNIADPAHPRVAGRMDRATLGGQGGSVAVRANRGYVLIPEHKMIAVLDVEDPARPTLIRHIRPDIPQPEHLEIHGDRLYVYGMASIDYLGGVWVFDIRTDSPRLLGSYQTTLTDPGFWVTKDHIALIARTPAFLDDVPKIDVVDMREPVEPRLLAQWAGPDMANIVGMHLRENRLYVTAYWGGTWVLDASNILDMRLLDRYDPKGEPSNYTIPVRALPPFIFAGQSGPKSDSNQWNVLRYDADGFGMELQIPAGSTPNQVYLEGNLLVLETLDPPTGPTRPEKVLRIYRVSPQYHAYLPRVHR